MQLSHFGISVFAFSLLNLTHVFAQELQGKTEVEQAAKSIMNEGSAPAAALKKLGKMVEEKGALLSEEARKEIDRYRIRLTIDPLGNIFDSENTEGGTYYQFVVEPAFRNRETLRRDVWSLDLSVGFGQFFSAGTTARISFNRYFSGPNARIDAITAPVYCPFNLIICKRKMPLNSNEVKTLLQPGEGFRLEILGDISLGLSEAHSLGSAGVRGKGAGLFLMDLYKFSEKSVRTRFVGIKNSGELELGIGLKKQAGTFFGSNVGFIKRNISIGFNASGKRSFDFLDWLVWEPKTLDSMMVDYLFNFSENRPLTEDELNNIEIAEAAFDQIFTNIKNGGFLPLFLTIEKGDQITKKLLKKAELAEKQSIEDLKRLKKGEIKFEQMRVANYFKGRFESFVRGFEIGARFFDVIGGNSLSGTVSSFVVSYDSEQKPNYFWLENSFTRHQSRALFGRSKYNLHYDVDILLLSDKDKNAGEISDVVIKNDIEDTRMSNSSIETYKKIVNNSLPNKYKNNEQVLNVIGTGQRTNTSLVYKTSFGEKFFQSVGQLNPEEVRLKLARYFDEHPERSYMQLPCDQTGEISVISFYEYTNQKAHQIAAIFDPIANKQQRLEAIKIASRDPIFDRYLIGEFFGHLVPDNTTEDIYSFEIKSSNFESGTKSETLGSNKISPVYEAVSFVRSIINNQSQDLQMTNSIVAP